MGSEGGGAHPLRKRRETSYETVAASPSTVVLLTTPLSRTSRAKLPLPRPVSPSKVSRPFLMGVLHEAVTGRAPARMRCSSSFSSCVSVTLPDEADRRLAVTHRRVATHKIARNMVYVRGVSSRCVCVSVTGDNTSFGLVVVRQGNARVEGSTGQPGADASRHRKRILLHTIDKTDKTAWTGRSGAARGAARQPHTRGFRLLVLVEEGDHVRTVRRLLEADEGHVRTWVPDRCRWLSRCAFRAWAGSEAALGTRQRSGHWARPAPLPPP